MMFKDGQYRRDREDEWRIRHVLEEAWGVELFKARILAPADFFAVRRFDLKTVAYVDLRFRNCRKGIYPEYYAGKEKLDRAIYLAAQNGIRFLFCIKFIDGLYTAEIDEARSKTFTAGYNERMAYPGRSARKAYQIPIAIFKRATEVEF